jgi:hypothetical protein
MAKVISAFSRRVYRGGFVVMRGARSHNPIRASRNNPLNWREIKSDQFRKPNQRVVRNLRPRHVGCLRTRRASGSGPHTLDVEASSTDKDHSRGNRRTRQERETGSGAQDDSAQEQRRLQTQDQVNGPSAGAVLRASTGHGRGLF